MNHIQPGPVYGASSFGVEVLMTSEIRCQTAAEVALLAKFCEDLEKLREAERKAQIGEMIAQQKRHAAEYASDVAENAEPAAIERKYRQ